MFGLNGSWQAEQARAAAAQQQRYYEQAKEAQREYMRRSAPESASVITLVRLPDGSFGLPRD